MKKLARKSLMTIAFSLLLVTLIINLVISFKNKDKAQSDFVRNSLSFLLSEEDNKDFIDILREFNKTHPDMTILYLDQDKNIIYNSSKISKTEISNLRLSDSNYDKKINIKNNILSRRVDYRQKGDNTLIISVFDGPSFLINGRVLFLYLLLAFATYFLIDKNVDKNIDKYLDGLSLYDAYKLDSSGVYEDIKPYFMNYMVKINGLHNEVDLLRKHITDITNITSNMKEGFILFDANGEIELINPSATKYLGVSDEPDIENLIDSKEYKLAIREANLLKKSKTIDIKIREYNLRIFIDPLSESDKKAFAMIIVDNSENKKAEEMRREFSANVTHELKSPLTSINGYAELIATGIAKEGDVNKFAEIIYNEGNRLLEIIDDIIKISRLDELNYERESVEVDIYEVAQDTIEKFKILLNNKNISVDNLLSHYTIKTSPSLFSDIITNIFENAIKYNKMGGKIWIKSEIKDDKYLLSISDNGIGIKESDIERIFERFYVVDKSRKRNQKSTGLGLSIVKHIIDHLGYSIEVDSKISQGSTFIIKIPL